MSCAGSVNELPFQTFTQKLSLQCSNGTVWKPGKKSLFNLGIVRGVLKNMWRCKIFVCCRICIHLSGFFFFSQAVIRRHPHQSYYLWWDSIQKPVMLTVWLSCTSFCNQERSYCSVYWGESLTLIFWGLAAFWSSRLLLQVGIICIKPVPWSVFHGLDLHSVQYWKKYTIKIIFKRKKWK